MHSGLMKSLHEMTSTLQDLLRPIDDMGYAPIFHKSEAWEGRPRPATENTASRNAPKSRFRFLMYLKNFEPEEVEVKVVDNFLVVHGKHEEKLDQHGFITREFTRRIKIPEDVDTRSIKSDFSTNCLSVSARNMPRKPLSNERIIPVEIQKPITTRPRNLLKSEELIQQTSAGVGDHLVAVEQTSAGTTTE